MPMTVLIIDDDPDFAPFLRTLMLGRQLQVNIASDGCQGIELLRHSQPDLIFLDLNMPDMDGIEVLRFLKSENRITRVVVTSGYIDEYQEKYPDLLNRVEILRKPFEMQQLDEILRQMEVY